LAWPFLVVCLPTILGWDGDKGVACAVMCDTACKQEEYEHASFCFALLLSTGRKGGLTNTLARVWKAVMLGVAAICASVMTGCESSDACAVVTI